MDAVAESAVPDVLAPGLGSSSAASTPGACRPRRAALRESPERLLAPSPRRRLHSAAARAGEQLELPELGFGLTNAAYRTTPRLRRPARSRLRGLGRAARVDRRASSTRRGSRSSGRRRTAVRSASAPELGLQERPLGDTRLFVLPSTSPANAAVPYPERLRWFRELRRWCSSHPRGRSRRTA